MASGSLVSRVLGLVRGVMLSMCVGALVINNAFNVANILPNYIYILLAGGLLNAILIPQITAAMQLPEGGRAQVDRLVTLVLLIVVPLSVVVTVSAGPLISLINGSQGAAYDLTVAFAYLTMPQVLFYSLYVLFGQILNARGQFAAYMWSPVLANIVQIAGMGVWLARYARIPGIHGDASQWTPDMVWWLAGTFTVGVALQALILVVPLWRGGFRYRPRFDVRGRGLKQAGTLAGWALAALALSQVGGLLSQYVLSVVTRDHPSVAGYGIYSGMFTLFMIPHSLVTTSIITAVFPSLARAVHSRDVSAQRVLITQCLTTPALAIIPLTAAALALAVPGVRLLNPTYAPHDAHAAAAVFMVMTVGMWAFGIRAVQERYTFARGDGRATLLFQVLVSGVALLFTLASLVVPPTIAALTVGAGLTVSSVAGAVAFLITARRQLGGLHLFDVTRLWVRLALASAVSAVPSWLTAELIRRGFDDSLLGNGVALVIGGAVFLLAFVALARLFRITEISALAEPFLGRRGARRVRGSD